MIRTLIAISVVLALVVSAGAYEVGDMVVVIREADLRVPSGAVDHVYPGTCVPVEAVNGPYLWINFGKRC